LTVGSAGVSMKINPRTPVLVGIGVVQQKDPARGKDTPRKDASGLGKDALALMIDAVRRAGADSGAPGLLAEAARIAVPQSLWSYEDPARAIANAIGARNAVSVLAELGVLQQSLLGDACARIASGEIDCAIVAGGEARYRALQARLAGIDAPESPAEGEPSERWKPAAELRLEAEVKSGLGYMPVGYYAIVESAFRAAHGWSVSEHRDRLATMYERFSEIAASNPHAWKREKIDAATIRGDSSSNLLMAFPYTKLHNSSWNVDQAAAVLLCSAERATAAGIAPHRWTFPRASTESNHMLALSERAELHRLPGARIAGLRALELAGLTNEDLDLVELYSCFPIAVEVFAKELGLPAGGDWTVTGGMPFAGGPLNNYVLQATCRMAELLRDGRGRHGLVTSVSGYLTKQGFGVWSSTPSPQGFAHEDVATAVAAASPPKPVHDARDGEATICGYTVMHDRGAVTGVVLVDWDDGSRSLACTQEEALVARMESEEMCGVRVVVAGRELRGIAG
jgi:acetyl-CoA C-acetyltransferase